ncbi:MAG: FkbM family methyltransferase, partial [Tannerellaceae bacterium]|nr:FkbM family methyltransferase [Tannerellaceae bacterium]
MKKTTLKKLTPDFVLFLLSEYQSYKAKRMREPMRKEIVKYLENLSSDDMTDEKREVLEYLKHHFLSYHVYPYVEKYKLRDIIVYADKEKRMYYVLHDNKRLYFKKTMSRNAVKRCYNELLKEQDVKSPHRYEDVDFHVCEGDVVVDAGAAEGIFALSVVEKAKKLYLFESDEEWIEPLEATFASYKDKVTIVNQYISDKCVIGKVDEVGNETNLDTFFENEKIDFIKADIEGAERQLLEGAERILQQADLKLVLCTYHCKGDAEWLEEKLVNAGFQVEFTKGYCLFVYGQTLTPPYLRRGVIRAR